MSVDVTDVLTKAWKAVQDAKIPEPLQELALSRAIDVVVGNYVPPSPPGGGGGKDTGPDKGSSESGTDVSAGVASGAASSEKEMYAKMSAGTGVPVATLERLVHLEKGVPKILLKKSALPKKSATSQKVITLILSVATHYLTGEEEVPLGPIRDEVQALNFFDSNFMQNISALPDILITGPRGGNKKVKIRKAFLQSFADQLSNYDLITE